MDKIYDLLTKNSDEVIDSIFKSYGRYTIYSQFNENNKDAWLYRTKKQARNYIKLFLTHPVKYHDKNAFFGEFRKIFQTGNDGHIKLQVNLGTRVGLSALYAGNPLFNDGITVPISYNEIINLISSDNIQDFSDDVFFLLQTEYMNLDFNTYWSLNEEKIGNKLIRAYNEYLKIFSKSNLGSYYTKTFRLSLYSDRGRGPSQVPITNRFPDLEGFNIDFNPNRPNELHNAIATMLTYLMILPDTLVDIRIADENTNTAVSSIHLLIADIFSPLKNEYIQENLYTTDTMIKRNKIRGVLMWDGSYSTAMTQTAYVNLIGAISGIFSHEDLHHFLGFNTPFLEILNKLQEFFRLKLVEDKITIEDLRK